MSHADPEPVSRQTVPILEAFWSQHPSGFSFAVIAGDHTVKAEEFLIGPHRSTFKILVRSSVVVSPSQLYRKLSRRRKGIWSWVSGVWASDGWTVVFNPDPEVGTFEYMAKVCAAPLMVVSWMPPPDDTVGIKEVAASGKVLCDYVSTPMTREACADSDTKRWLSKQWVSPAPEVVADPSPNGLTKALKRFGFDVAKHMLAEREIATYVYGELRDEYL